MDNKKINMVFLAREVECCKKFIQTQIIFQPYYYISYKELYSRYTELIEKQTPESKPVTSNSFWFLLKIALSEMNLNVCNNISRRYPSNTLIYQGIGIKY